MRKTILGLLVNIVFLGNFCFGNYNITNYEKYIIWHNPMPFPIYRMYLNLATAQLSTQFYFCIRQPITVYPGDYFYPPDAYIPREFAQKSLNVKLSSTENNLISNFIGDNLFPIFSDSLVLSSLNGYGFDYPNGPHREVYTMLTEGDTVYVISGWLGKFLSFYRVVPGDTRLTIPELMKQLEKITPLSKEIKENGFRQESDSLNYLLEYVDKDQMFRVRNYLMKTTLPPNPPDAPEKYYNLIEVTKFYDREAIP